MSKQRQKQLRIGYIVSYDLSGMPVLKTEHGDTEEQLKVAHAQIAYERDRIATAKASARPRLSGKRNIMSAPIELAMSEAFDPRDLFSVWAALVAIAERPDRRAPLLGMTDDGSAIRYRNGGKVELFTQAMLKQRLGRQRKSKDSL